MQRSCPLIQNSSRITLLACEHKEPRRLASKNTSRSYFLGKGCDDDDNNNDQPVQLQLVCTWLVQILDQHFRHAVCAEGFVVLALCGNCRPMVLDKHCRHAVCTEDYVVVALCTYSTPILLDLCSCNSLHALQAYGSGLALYIVGIECVQIVFS